MQREWTSFGQTRPNFLLIATLCALALIVVKANAELVPVAKPIKQSVAQAKIVAVVTLTRFVPDSKTPSRSAAEKTHELEVWGQLLKPAGVYTFDVLQVLKGTPRKTVILSLPILSTDQYNSARLLIEPGKRFLLLLDENPQQQYQPIDNSLPFIPLGSRIPSAPDVTSAEAQVVRLLLASLVDPTLRRANTYLLRQDTDVQIPAGLLPYLNDADLQTQDAVLYCLATNQQVSIIPRIAELEAEQEAKGQGTLCIQDLAGYKTVEAVPYLNPLLFETAYYTRLNTMFGLANTADATSIPYLILTLHDPDPQRVIPSGAWGLLHRLIPTLGTLTQDSDYFYTHRETEIQPINQWWSDELAGKHLPKGQTTAPAQGEMPKTTKLLNPLLFQPYASVRRQAMTRLEALGDKSSIPYLLLAVQDPDSDIAYRAYKLLHRLIGTLGPTSERDVFETHREAETRPLYAWWSDELLGKHLPTPTAAGLAPNAPVTTAQP